MAYSFLNTAGVFASIAAICWLVWRALHVTRRADVLTRQFSERLFEVDSNQRLAMRST